MEEGPTFLTMQLCAEQRRVKGKTAMQAATVSHSGLASSPILLRIGWAVLSGERIDVGCARFLLLKPNYHRRFSSQRRNGFQTRLYDDHCSLRSCSQVCCREMLLQVRHLDYQAERVTYLISKRSIQVSGPRPTKNTNISHFQD